MFLIVGAMDTFYLPIQAATNDPYGPKSMKSPSVLTVKSAPRVANPGVYWYQLDDGSFKADHTTGPTFSRNLNPLSCSSPYPDEKDIPDEVDFSNWPATQWNEYNGYPITSSVLKSIRIKSVTYQTRLQQTSYTGIGETVIRRDSTIVKINTKTGGNHSVSDRTEFENGGKTNQNCVKQVVAYHTPMDIIWEGDLEEEKQIDVTPDSTLTVGETKQMVAKVKTKNYGATQFSEGIDVSSAVSEMRYVPLFQIARTKAVPGFSAFTIPVLGSILTILGSDDHQVVSASLQSSSSDHRCRWENDDQRYRRKHHHHCPICGHCPAVG